MIKVKYTITKEHRHEIRMEGHAGSDREGSDLVCCAASSLVYALAMRLQQMLHDYRVHGVVIQLDKGEAIIAASPSDKSGYRLNEAFETIYAGLSLLAVKYPSNVQCDFQREK